MEELDRAGGWGSERTMMIAMVVVVVESEGERGRGASVRAPKMAKDSTKLAKTKQNSILDYSKYL